MGAGVSVLTAVGVMVALGVGSNDGSRVGRRTEGCRVVAGDCAGRALAVGAGRPATAKSAPLGGGPARTTPTKSAPEIRIDARIPVAIPAGTSVGFGSCSEFLRGSS